MVDTVEIVTTLLSLALIALGGWLMHRFFGLIGVLLFILALSPVLFVLFKQLTDTGPSRRLSKGERQARNAGSGEE